MDLFASFWPLAIVTVCWAYDVPMSWFGSFVMAFIIALQGVHVFALRKTMELRERVYQSEWSEGDQT